MEQNGRSIARPPAFFVAHSNFRSWDFIYYAPGRVVAAARHDIIIATVPRTKLSRIFAFAFMGRGILQLSPPLTVTVQNNRYLFLFLLFIKLATS